MLTRWNDFGFQSPFLALEDFRRQMDSLFNAYERAAWPRAVRTYEGPRTSLYDAGDAFVVKAEVPGLSENDLTIDLTGDVLTLRGERKAEVPEGWSVHRRERTDWKFSRSFTLPAKVNPEKTSATLRNGILTITLEKAPETRPRRIEVKGEH